MRGANERASSVDTGVAQARLLQPGRNCWRVEPAARVAVLVDGAAYFSAFADAAKRTQHSIFVIGWDFNSGVRLHPERDGSPDHDQIGRFLHRLAARIERRASELDETAAGDDPGLAP